MRQDTRRITDSNNVCPAQMPKECLHTTRLPHQGDTGCLTDGQQVASYTSEDLGGAPHQPDSARMSLARLLKRVFDIGVEYCPKCGDTLKITL